MIQAKHGERVSLRDGGEIRLRLDRQYIVEVRGWVMCSKVGAGQYRMKLAKDREGRLVAVLYRPKGKKELVRHYVSNLGLMSKDSRDLNGTIILEDYVGSL